MQEGTFALLGFNLWKQELCWECRAVLSPAPATHCPRYAVPLAGCSWAHYTVAKITFIS